MSSPKKSKKVLAQFAIALVIAVVLGFGAIVVGVTLIKSISARAADTQKEAAKKAEELKSELESMKRREESARNDSQFFQIVQTQVDISPGTVITDDMLALARSQDTTQQAALKNPAQIVGKMVKGFTPKGSFLKNTDLMGADEWLVVQPNKRAITIRVDGNGTVSGSVGPGSKVDVIGTIVPQQGDPFSRTLIEDALVMRMENNVSSKGIISAMTLLATAKEAEALSLVGQIGFYHVTLRNMADKSRLAGKGGTTDQGGINSYILARPLTGAPASSAAATIAATKKSTRVATATHHRHTDENIHNASFSPNAALPNPGEGGPLGGRSRFSMKVFRGSGSEVVEFQR
jgi:pilus assembly protein CpaB